MTTRSDGVAKPQQIEQLPDPVVRLRVVAHLQRTVDHVAVPPAEWDDATCALAISVDRALFDAAADRPGHYVVAAAHRPRDGERIVRRDGEAVVVERRPEPVAI